METWKILVISLSAALVLGVIGGTIIGKIMVKRAKSPHKPLLSNKERMVYSACVLLGTGLVLFGVFFNFSKPEATNMAPDGTQQVEQGAANGDAGVAVARAGKPRIAVKMA